MSYTYKNKTDRTLALPDVGLVLAGGTIKSEKFIENPNLELVSDGSSEPVENKTQTEEKN